MTLEVRGGGSKSACTKEIVIRPVYSGTITKNVAKSVHYQYGIWHNETLVIQVSAHACISWMERWKLEMDFENYPIKSNPCH